MPDLNQTLQALTYAAQLADGMNTARVLKHPGIHEDDPLVKPFSHGGLPMQLAGGAAFDYGLNRLENARHWSQGSRNNAALAQLMAHLAGIFMTNKNSHLSGQLGPQHPMTQLLMQFGVGRK